MDSYFGVVDMIRKLPSTLLAASMLLSAVQSHADFVGIYAGVGVWQSSIDGEVGTDDIPLTSDELGFDDEQNTHAFVAFEHPVPVLPNVRLAMTSLDTSGTELISRGSTEELLIAIDSEFSIPDGATATSQIDLDFVDFTLYYELLDNYVSLDLGLTARQLDGSASFSYEIESEDTTVTESTAKDLDFILPMLYTKVQLDLPLTGWYFGGQANIISYDDNSVSDIEAKIGYMTDGLGLDIGFDLGFRRFAIETDPDNEDLKVDLTLDGPFASVFVHF